MLRRSEYRPVDVVLLAVSEAVSSLLVFARCLFCRWLECLPSWHRLWLWQCKCTTFPRGVEGSRSSRGGGGGGFGGVTRAKSRDQDTPPPPPPNPFANTHKYICTHKLPRHRYPSPCPVYHRPCAMSAEALANQLAWVCIDASPKAATTTIEAPQPPPAKVGQLSPHIIPIDCLLLCLPILSIGFVSLDDALHSTSPTLIHTVITFQYQR